MDAGFLMAESLAVWKAISRCWSADVFIPDRCTSVLASDIAGTKYFCLELIDVVTVGISIVIETVQSLV